MRQRTTSAVKTASYSARADCRSHCVQAAEDTIEYLRYVGTWHSHPLRGSHSPTHWKTFRTIAGYVPSLLGFLSKSKSMCSCALLSVRGMPCDD
jgi:hypothetical protein